MLSGAGKVISMRRFAFVSLVVSSFALSACLGTVADVVTAPVKMVSKGVDLVTTSQSEADEKRGREIRKREERLGKLERRYEEELEDCREGSRRACGDARQTHAEMQLLIPTIPAEPPKD